MEDRDAWLEDVKRWYFDERRAEGEHGLPIVAPAWRPAQKQRREGPTLPASRPHLSSAERPDAH